VVVEICGTYSSIEFARPGTGTPAVDQPTIQIESEMVWALWQAPPAASPIRAVVWWWLALAAKISTGIAWKSDWSVTELAMAASRWISRGGRDCAQGEMSNLKERPSSPSAPSLLIQHMLMQLSRGRLDSVGMDGSQHTSAIVIVFHSWRRCPAAGAFSWFVFPFPIPRHPLPP